MRITFPAEAVSDGGDKARFESALKTVTTSRRSSPNSSACSRPRTALSTPPSFPFFRYRIISDELATLFDSTTVLAATAAPPEIVLEDVPVSPTTMAKNQSIRCLMADDNSIARNILARLLSGKVSC